MDLDLYDDTYDTFCEEVNIENATILEIGCGPGNITKYLLNKRPDFRIEGVDVSPNMILLAVANSKATTDYQSASEGKMFVYLMPCLGSAIISATVSRQRA